MRTPGPVIHAALGAVLNNTTIRLIINSETLEAHSALLSFENSAPCGGRAVPLHQDGYDGYHLEMLRINSVASVHRIIRTVVASLVRESITDADVRTPEPLVTLTIAYPHPRFGKLARRSNGSGSCTTIPAGTFKE